MYEQKPFPLDRIMRVLFSKYNCKHKNSFEYEDKRNTTELSNFIWEQKKKTK